MDDEDNNDEDLFMFLKALSELKTNDEIERDIISDVGKESNTEKDEIEIDNNIEKLEALNQLTINAQIKDNNDKGKQDDIANDALISPVNEKEAQEKKTDTDENNNNLNISVDERMIIKEDEDDDEDDDKDDKDGVINFKAEIEARDSNIEDNDNKIKEEQKEKENNDLFINDNDKENIDKHSSLPEIILNDNEHNIQLLEETPLSLLRTKHHYIKSHFEIISLLNKGYYASILKAKYIKNKAKNEMKALKAIEVSTMKTNNMLHKIYLENEILIKLNHPNIINLEGAFEEKDKIFLVFNYFPKGNFADFLKVNYPLNDETVRCYTGEIINALEYLRDKNIIHCNLKLENIMIDDNYHLKLIGFSNAKMNGKIFNRETMRFEDPKGKLNNEDDRDPNRNIIFNQNESPEYAGPEVIKNHDCGFGTDLWSLGCIIYQMYAGATPFKDKSDHLIVQNILKNQIVYPPYLPEDAQDLISQLLINNSSKRLGSGDNGTANDFKQLKSHKYFDNLDFNKLSIESIPHQGEFRIWTTNKPQILANYKTMYSNIKTEPVIREDSFMRNHTKTISTIKQAIVDKKSPWLHYNRRKIVLDTTPKLEYIDPTKNIIKGVIFLNKECKAVHIDAKIFELITPKRIFRFKV